MTSASAPMSSESPVLLREQHGLVQVLTLNRPEAANSLDPMLLDALTTALREIDADDGSRVVVVTGAGERIFCAGMDLRAFSDRHANAPDPGGLEPAEPGPGGAGPAEPGPAEPGPAEPAGESAHSPTVTMGPGNGHSPSASGLDLFGHLCAKPVIAAVNGAAVGGGFELVLACDLVVAAEHARFGLPEVKRGLLPAGGGTLLGTRIPLSLALEVALTGELVDAERAASWGLVNRIVPAPRLLEASLELASTVAANGPLALRVIKRLIRRAVIDDPKLGWGTPEELATVFGSDDAKEGARAFLEKRRPVWSGR